MRHAFQVVVDEPIVAVRMPWVVRCTDCGGDVEIAISADMPRLVVCACGLEFVALEAWLAEVSR